MIWRNPFLIKNSDRQGERDFLTLFDSTVLQIIDTNHLEMTSYVSSTPGAGKTSLFKAFSPVILNAIKNDTSGDYSDIHHHMERLGIIAGDSVQTLSTYLSCARGYSIIDEMFQNGRRKQIFFALLNYRIAILFLKSACTALELELGDLYRLTFRDIPPEMESEIENYKNGELLYKWACKGERELCGYLDSERQEQLNVSFIHTTLIMLKLFEPENVLFDMEPVFLSTLIIFDDFHKLTNHQKNIMSEAIYTLKSNTGVWLGQRLEGMQSTQIVSMDGSLNRDYNKNIVIDNYWPNQQKQFYKMLESIADRRVEKANLPAYQKMTDCISDEISYKKYEKALTRYIKKIESDYLSSFEGKTTYSDILSYIDSNNMKTIDKALWYECIKIKENRKFIGQMKLFLEEIEPVDTFKVFVSENENAAKYYIAFNCNIPFYYGFKNLKILSSYNIEQFLFFAAEYMECCRIKSLSTRVKRQQILSAEEQEQIVKKAVLSKWEDMELRYANIQEIKAFLDKVGDFGKKSRLAERNSYNGGAYTGFGISKKELMYYMDDPKYGKIYDILGACLESKYLERKEINNKDIIVVFYLNRWLCVHYELPLAYGGWKKCGIEALKRLCDIDNM